MPKRLCNSCTVCLHLRTLLARPKAQKELCEKAGRSVAEGFGRVLKNSGNGIERWSHYTKGCQS
jgi:hypothetical protein